MTATVRANGVNGSTFRAIPAWLDAMTANPRTLLFIVMAMTALARIAAMLKFADIHPATANLWEYGDQALCALRHHTDLCGLYHDRSLGAFPSAYMPPVLSYVWYVLFAVFGDTAFARVLFLTLGLAMATANGGLVFTLARRLGASSLAALFAGLIFAVYPTFVYVTAVYHNTNFAVLLELVLALLTIKMLEAPKPDWRVAAGLGFVAGLATLNRSEMMIIGPAAFLGVTAWRRAPKMAAIALLVFGLTLTPWIARNYAVFHKFIPAAQSSGYNLWKGYNPWTNGSGNYSETYGPSAARADQIRYSVAPGPMFETRVQDAFAREFKAYVAHAGAPRLLQLAVNKFALLWVFDWTDTDITGRITYRLPWLIANALVLIGGFGLYRSRKVNLPVLAVIVGALALFTAAYVTTDVHSRYRMHIEPFLFIFAGIGAETLLVFAAPAFGGLAGRGMSHSAKA